MAQKRRRTSGKNQAKPRFCNFTPEEWKEKGHDYDDDSDPYDDPDFDDLIPGEEYDEEFIDRSTGDPELYVNP